ncbi:MAG: ABC transporter transmembrane domain-containing protein [Patescibacteria group bacterium]
MQAKLSLIYFLRFAKNYRLLIVGGLLLLIAAKVAATIEPIYLRNIINALTAHQPLTIITSFLVFYFGIKFLGIVFEFLRDWVFSPVIMGVSRDIEKAVFSQLLKLPVSYHADQKAGAAARAVARGSRAISFVLDFSITQFLPPIFELIFVTIILLRLYTWQYGIITLATIIFYTWFTIWSTEKRQIFRQEGNKKDDQASGTLVDAISNIETVKYFNNESILFNLFAKIKQEWFNLLVKNNRLFALIFSSQGIILLIGLGLILIIAVRQTSAGIISVGDLILVSTYIVRLSAPITTLGFVYGQFKNSFADLEAMAGILNRPVTIKEPEKPKAILNPRGEIIFNKVSFRYEKGRKNALCNLNLTIRPGQKVAFVGSSGAGKSTISKLIFRLYEVTEGEILIDKINLCHLSAKTRQELLAIVPQEPALFNDTFRENIRFGKTDSSQKEIEEAAKAAQIHDLISSLPQKYDTIVGERGIKISGGEKQRVAIARAIIKNPKILVFDEATSSLDSHSEQAILTTLDKVARGRTTIAIAHRLSTIIHSDIIYVLDKGMIAEQGNHELLFKKDGLYAKLWRIQSRTRKERI